MGCIDSWFVSCVKSVNSTSMESLWKEVKCNALGVHCAGSFNFFNLHKGGTQCNCSVGSLFPGRSLLSFEAPVGFLVLFLTCVTTHF